MNNIHNIGRQIQSIVIFKIKHNREYRPIMIHDLEQWQKNITKVCTLQFFFWYKSTAVSSKNVLNYNVIKLDFDPRLEDAGLFLKINIY